MFKNLFGKKNEIETEAEEHNVTMVIRPQKTGEALEIEQLGQAVRANTENGMTEIPRFNRAQVEAFEVLLEARVQAYLNDEENEGDIEDDDDLYALKADLGYRLFEEILPESTEGEREFFATEYAAKLKGLKTVRTAQASDNTHDSVHGIDLKMFAEGSYRMANGEDGNNVIASYGVSPEQWADISTEWVNRMGQDSTLAILYGQYMIPGSTDAGTSSIVDDRLVSDRRFFQDVYAYYLAACEAELDAEGLVKEKFGYTNFDLQQANQVWAKHDATSYEHSVFFDPFFDARKAEYERELNKQTASGSGIQFDMQDFAKQAQLMDPQACINSLDANHRAVQFLKTKDADALEELGKILVYRGDATITGKFTTYADDLFADNEALSDETIGMVIVLGNFTVTKDAEVYSNLFVDGTFTAKSIDLRFDNESQVVLIMGDCIATTGVFISDSLINLYIEGELQVPRIFSAVRAGNVKVQNIAPNTLGINGYADEDELGMESVLSDFGVHKIISVEALSQVSNFSDDASATEDIISDIIDGTIKFQ